MIQFVALAAIALLVGCNSDDDNPIIPDDSDSSDSPTTPDDINCDQDGDGSQSVECGGADCDDTNPVIDGVKEVCYDGIDNDCDNNIDDTCDIYYLEDGGSIQQALDTVVDGGEVRVPGGNYQEVLSLIDKEVTLTGCFC